MPVYTCNVSLWSLQMTSVHQFIQRYWAQLDGFGVQFASPALVEAMPDSFFLARLQQFFVQHDPEVLRILPRQAGLLKIAIAERLASEEKLKLCYGDLAREQDVNMQPMPTYFRFTQCALDLKKTVAAMLEVYRGRADYHAKAFTWTAFAGDMERLKQIYNEIAENQRPTVLLQADVFGSVGASNDVALASQFFQWLSTLNEASVYNFYNLLPLLMGSLMWNSVKIVDWAFERFPAEMIRAAVGPTLDVFDQMAVILIPLPVLVMLAERGTDADRARLACKASVIQCCVIAHDDALEQRVCDLLTPDAWRALSFDVKSDLYDRIVDGLNERDEFGRPITQGPLLKLILSSCTEAEREELIAKNEYELVKLLTKAGEPVCLSHDTTAAPESDAATVGCCG